MMDEGEEVKSSRYKHSVQAVLTQLSGSCCRNSNTRMTQMRRTKGIQEWRTSITTLKASFNLRRPIRIRLISSFRDDQA